MKIGIIGSGMVAKTLGNGFIKHGYEVMISSRDTSKLSEWKTKAGDLAHTGSFEQAAKFGDILVLAVAGKVAADAMEMAGMENMAVKTIIDTTNPIDGPPKDGVLQYFTNSNESLMEILQHRFPAVHLVKAFNSVGNACMVNPQVDGGKPTMFICGNSEKAKDETKTILDIFGWEVEDMGKAAAAGSIESLCILWCIPGFLRNQWSHVFKLIKV
jgi:8-hydroxy-5-deazaflavin:NADPH oxidoreductase